MLKPPPFSRSDAKGPMKQLGQVRLIRQAAVESNLTERLIGEQNELLSSLEFDGE